MEFDKFDKKSDWACNIFHVPVIYLLLTMPKINITRSILFIFLLLGWIRQGTATHIVGGELSYIYLGNDNYSIRLYLYIDCVNGNPGAISSDVNSQIGVFDQFGTLQRSLPISRQGPERIEGKNYTCVQPQANACVDLYIYTATANLPPITGGYTLVFQRCCRNNTIKNIVTPESTGSTYRTFIPDRRVQGANNSAKFNAEPPNFLCQGEPLVFDHRASDADGDSLVYRLFQPLHGASQAQPQPMPFEFTPQVGVTWQSAFNTSNQMASNPPMSVNDTGLLELTPSNTGQYVVGIAVDEYRNGVLINTVFRDFQFNVIPCIFDVKSVPGVQGGPCSNTLSFRNFSTGNVAGYTWFFGDPTNAADSSNSKEPSYTYPGPGKYTVRLDALSNTGCRNTRSIQVYILDDIDGLLQDSVVCYGTQIQLGDPQPDPQVTWDWQPDADLDNSKIRNPVATVKQNRTYKVFKNGPTCYVQGEVNVKVNPIDADFIHEYLPPCDGLRVKYFARGKDYTSLSWDFGDPVATNDRPTDSATSWFYQDTGIMYVTLRVANEHCTDSITKPIRIIFPEVFTAVIDSAICLGDEIRIGPLNDTSILSFTWSTDSFMSDGNALYPDVKPERSISYVLVKTYAHCTQKDSFSIQVNELPNLSINKTGDDRVCLGDTIELASSGNYTFEWFPKNGILSPFSPVTLLVPDSSRWYTLQAITSSSCMDTVNVFVEMYPIWELDLNPGYVVCIDEVFLPEVNIPEATITWKEQDQDFFVDSIRKEGRFIVNARTQCQDLYDTFQVAHYINDYCTVQLPNAFTPNGDGINDTYPFDGKFHNIFGMECTFDEYQLIIFNRWGEIVFRSSDPSESWNGTHKGNDGTEDVYGYYLTYREYDWCEGGHVIRVKKGNITILH